VEPPENADEIWSALEKWLAGRAADLRLHDERLSRWQELQDLLATRTIQDLEEEESNFRHSAEALEAKLQSVGLRPEAGNVEALRQEYELISGLASNADGRVDIASSELPDLNDAEMQLSEVQRELDRVQSLGEILELTRKFLEQAQERVHRDIAPRLAEVVERWLPNVTQGRYKEVAVDPNTLEVRVRAPGHLWRPVSQLSHGTQEQIYLLLRAAMAMQLPKPGETCPLILDDVTVHYDEGRTVAALEVLHELSRNQQVIVFTQEGEVLSWAERELNDNDRLMKLRENRV
jgi:uncharacterized protein YhaN